MSKGTNAKNEFLLHIGNRKVKCVRLSSNNDSYDKETISYELGCGYNQDEWNIFLNKINFYYDSGYGSRPPVSVYGTGSYYLKLRGTIWYEDGTWSSRGEYDGSEWYEYNKCPDIPELLKRIDIVRNNKINELTKND